MKSTLKPLLLAGLLATAGVAALAQTPGPAMMGGHAPMHEGMEHQRMGHRDPARMQAWIAKRQAELKARLQLTPAQEDAWTAFTAAMKPSADMQSHRAERAELAKLPTPERIDQMKALRARHMADMNAAMDRRGDAAKAFYAVLTPEQQKVFDASTARHHRAGGWRGGPGGDRGTAPAKS